MSTAEAINFESGDTAPKLSSEEYLRLLGWRFRRPVDQIFPKQEDRVNALGSQAGSVIERAEKRVDTAYYALELGNGLPPLQEAINRVELLGEHRRSDPDSTKDDEILDDFLLATAVDSVLHQAYDQFAAASVDQLIYLNANTAHITAENTAAIKAVRHLAQANKSGGWIGSRLAKDAEYLLRIVIANEAQIDNPLEKAKNHLQEA